MASLRGSDVLWTAANPAQNANSAEGFVGTNTNVIVLIKNSGGNSATFKIQVSAPAKPSAGRNVDPTDWYDLNGQTSIVVAAGANVAVGLSPFAPPYLRLVRTDATTAVVIDASVVGLALT